MLADVTRRHFFYGALLAGAMPPGGFGSARSLKALGYKSPNEKLNIAAIGAGGRAADDIAGCDSENIVALADPDAHSAERMFQRYDKAAKYTDFRKMLDREGSGIDAVIIAIPDHMHATAAMWAMERGKHVYVEKPLTRTVWEARRLAEAAVKYGVATQMGNQGYSNEGARIASEIIWSGEIGQVTEVHAWTSRPWWPQGMTEVPKEEAAPPSLDWDLWLGIAEMRPYTSGGEAYAKPQTVQTANGTYTMGPNGFYQPFNWRGFYDFGCGSLGDMACHLLGAANMALLPGAPKSVEVVQQEGRSSFAFPKKSVTVFDFPARKSMAPVKVYWYDAATGPMYRPAGIPEDEPLIGGPGAFGAQAMGDRRPGPRGGYAREGAVFVGEKGFLTTDTYAARVRLLPEARHNEYKLPPKLLTRSPGHYRDWIRACKGGEPACSNFSVSAPFTEWVLLGIAATHFEGRLDWDAAKMQFTNNPEANQYLKPTFRRGWSFS